jgi:isopentenyldiphosphate isomerase
MSYDEILDIVDADDQVIGSATRGEIHQEGLMHRAVHIFVFDASGNIYVQRRSESKDRHPLKLDSSAAGHVDSGESYDRAAERELAEELGIAPELQPVLRVPASNVTDQEHVMLYACVTDLSPVPNADEIVWGGFMLPDELTSGMDANPDDYVPAFIFLWKEYLKLESS